MEPLSRPVDDPGRVDLADLLDDAQLVGIPLRVFEMSEARIVEPLEKTLGDERLGPDISDLDPIAVVDVACRRRHESEGPGAPDLLAAQQREGLGGEQENPVTLQGGLSEGFEKEESFYEHFYAATNGETLSKTPQPVPGGLTGLVNCKEISLSWLRASCESIFENGLTGVNATLELARPASEIIVSESNLAGRSGTALQLPVRVHLENPLLGSTCYIGSSSTPLLWKLTTGTTKPPAGTAPISGTSGKLEFIENEEIAQFSGVKLVDNTWSAPGAVGCGGFPAEYILDPIINASVGVPSAAGKNAAILENTRISLAEAASVNEH